MTSSAATALLLFAIGDYFGRRVSRSCGSRAQRVTDLLLVLAISACVIAGPLTHEFVFNDVDLDRPFEAAKAGAIAEDVVRVPQERQYNFDLDLYYPADNSNARQRVAELTGQRSDSIGLPIPVRLTVTRIRKHIEQPVLEGIFARHKLYGWGAAFSKTITTARLPPGRYRVRIEALEDIRQLQDVPVHFRMHTRALK